MPVSWTPYYRVYNTFVNPLDGVKDMQLLPATLQLYAPQGSTALPDNTAVDIGAKYQVSASGAIAIEAFHCSVFPGDPSEDEYDEVLPDTAPHAVVVCGIAGETRTHKYFNEESRRFPVHVVDYIFRVGGQVSDVTVLLPGTKRWEKTKTPAARSTAHIAGIVYGLDETGKLMIEAKSITVNLDVGRTGNQSSPTGLITPAGGKKRKLAPSSLQQVSPTKRQVIEPQPADAAVAGSSTGPGTRSKGKGKGKPAAPAPAPPKELMENADDDSTEKSADKD